MKDVQLDFWNSLGMVLEDLHRMLGPARASTDSAAQAWAAECQTLLTRAGAIIILLSGAPDDVAIQERGMIIITALAALTEQWDTAWQTPAALSVRSEARTETKQSGKARRGAHQRQNPPEPIT